MFLLPSILWVAFSLCWLHPLIHRSFKLWYCRGPASAESRDILRMDDVGEWRKIEKEIRKEWHRVTKLQWARPIYFILLGAFIPWVIHTARWKNAESTQHSISNNFYRYQVPSCKSLIFCTLSSGLETCWYFMTSFW